MSKSGSKTSGEQAGEPKRPRGRPFVKGDPRIRQNKKGRPPAARCIPDLLRWSGALDAPEKLVEAMREAFGIQKGTKITVDQACILRSRYEALKGDISHLHFWAERTEGKPKQEIDLNTTEGKKPEITKEEAEARLERLRSTAENLA